MGVLGILLNQAVVRVGLAASGVEMMSDMCEVDMHATTASVSKGFSCIVVQTVTETKFDMEQVDMQGPTESVSVGLSGSVVQTASETKFDARLSSEVWPAAIPPNMLSLTLGQGTGRCR